MATQHSMYGPKSEKWSDEVKAEKLALVQRDVLRELDMIYKEWGKPVQIGNLMKRFHNAFSKLELDAFSFVDLLEQDNKVVRIASNANRWWIFPVSAEVELGRDALKEMVLHFEKTKKRR